jgi:hypothetical protein
MDTFSEELVNTKFDEKKENLLNDNGLPVTVELSRPISFGKKVFEKLIFTNEITFGMRQHLPIDPNDYKQGHFDPIIAGMCGVSIEVIHQLTPPDAYKCYILVYDFLVNGRKTL